MLRTSLTECAVNGTVVASVLTTPETAVMLPLARSAATAGFPCIVVQPIEHLPTVSSLSNSDSHLMLMLPLPPAPLLPRSRWCNTTQYTARRLQFYRLRLWRLLLDAKLDVLGVDSAMRLKRSPLPALSAMRTRDKEEYGSGAPPDFVGHTPGWYLKQYSLSAGVWIRSTYATRSVLHQAEARVHGGQDELVFSEELSWGASSNATSLPCCHSECLGLQLTHAPVVKLSTRQARSSKAPNKPCVSDDSPPLAPPPPNASHHAWPDPNKHRGGGRTHAGRALVPTFFQSSSQSQG